MSIGSKRKIIINGALGLFFYTIGLLLCFTLVGMIVGFPLMGIGLVFFTMVNRMKNTEAQK